MRPIYLSIEGLNSFRQKQEIDFETLCRDGLFGIFGATGSGKSTILDAITLALYGSVVRARSNTQGILNSECDTLCVVFVFRMGQTGYRVSRGYARHGERRDSVRSKSATLYRIEAETEVLLADKPGEVERAIAEILPLSMDEFTRTVVLPQGQFAGFLTMEKAERRRMLEKVFALSRYGETLMKNMKAEETELNLLRATLEGQLGELTDASEEACQAALEEEAAAAADVAQKQEAAEAAQKRYQEAETVRRIQTDYEEAGRVQAALEQRADEMKQGEARLQNAEKAEAVRAELERGRGLAALCAVARRQADESKAAHERALQELERAQRLRISLQDAEKEEEEDVKRLARLEDARKTGAVLQGKEKVREEKAQAYKAANKEAAQACEAVRHIQERLEAQRAEKDKEEEQRRGLSLSAGRMAELRARDMAQAACTLASSLQEGAPCPVCGSCEHPAPTAAGDGGDALYHEAIGNMERLEALDAAIAERDAAMRALTEALDVARAKEWEAQARRAAIEQEGKAIRADIETLREQILQVAQTGDVEAAIAGVTARRDERAARAKQAEAALHQAQQAVQEALIAQEQAKGRLGELSAQQEAWEQKMPDLLRGAGFASIESAEAAQMTAEARLDAAEKLKQYHQQRETAAVKLAELARALDGRNITAEAWASIESGQCEARQAYEAARERAAVAASSSARMRERAARRQAVQQRYDEYTVRRARYESLRALLKGNALVEYVGQQYMASIAHSATVRLQALTNRRYALLLEEGDFMVEDRYNGGLCRPCASLSGGETFLVSLALAVSLSEHIMLKTPTPLAFFFLDEGFGTLDATLLEVVLDALESLRSEALSIGVISHLPQLRERMERFLLVEGASMTGEGTRVTMGGA